MNNKFSLKNRNKKGEILTKKMKRSLEKKKHTNKPKEHMEIQLIHFDSHKDLRQSEENKCV